MRILIFVLAMLPLSACTTGSLPSFSPSTTLPDVAFRTSAQHDSVMADKEWPYVLELGNEDTGLLYYGSWHTNDADDPQIADIETRFTEFRPTVAVTENTGGFHLPGRKQKIKFLGEFGQVIHLAEEAGIPVWTLEPTWEDEVSLVLETFSREEATLFYTLRVYLSERGDEVRPEKLEDLALHLLKKRGARTGLDRSVSSIEEMDAVWTSQFFDERDWRTLPSSAVWPNDDGTRLQQLSALVNQVRDRHAAAIILELTARGERVFAIAGGSHVVKQEPVLRAGLSGQ